VLLALAADPFAWRHGYDLLVDTGLQSGSLYPILMRLEDRGFLEAVWETGPPTGRPPRHLYRLTADGRALVATLDGPSIAPRARGVRLHGAS
jgi:DNA-binding PadR family transcriptional regulator